MTSCGKALLVGSSFSAATIFFALKKRGIHVSVCGKIESDPCHQYADESFFIDYSDSEVLTKIVENGDFNYLVPSCNDYSYMSCTTVASKHDFPGYDTCKVAQILHTKGSFREFTSSRSLPAPRYVKYSSDKTDDFGELKYPILVKPVDSFSGRGMEKILSEEQLPAAIDNAIKMSRSGEIVLEEFVEGSLHSHSAFIKNENIYCDFFVDEFCTIYPYQVNCSNHPSIIPETIQRRIRESIVNLIKSLGLVDGLLHTQLIMNGDEFWIIECMRRCPGDLYGSLVGFSTGVDYANLFISPFLNKEMSSPDMNAEFRFFGRHTISVKDPIINFSFSHKIPSRNVEVVPLKESGFRLDPAPFDKLAILFAEFDKRETMIDVTPKFAEMVQISNLGDK